MRRWAIITVLLYVAGLAFLTFPLCYLGAANWDLGDRHWWIPEPDSWRKGILAYQEWGYWVLLGFLGLCQGLMLLVPLDIARERPTPRRKLLVPVITGAFLMTCLVGAGVCCFYGLAYGDGGGPDLLEYWVNAGFSDDTASPVIQTMEKFLGFSLDKSTRISLGILAMLGLLWAAWALIFHQCTRRDEPEKLNRRLLHWLLKGSILEFLVALPSHVIVRGRHDCCAPAGTFLGIVTGVCLMLLAFGPGVFFLFVARFQRLKPGRNNSNLG
ncbi:MAG: hypothetical protein WCO56_23590 [Verrucomicrobiota bacterium]